MAPENIESSRHDPLLRLDQFIHRQDEMIDLLILQNRLLRLSVYASWASVIILALILLLTKL